MNSFAQFITVLLIFIIVLAVTYFVTRFVGNYQKTAGSSGNIELIESARIAPSVYVEIVRIGKKYVALSVSKDSSSYICDIPQEDLEFRDDGSLSGLKFDAILDKVRAGIGTKDGSDDKGSHCDE